MQLHRRKFFLHLTVGGAALAALPRSATAADYPTRPVRIIAGFPPGGVNDTYARLIGGWLSDHLGQQFVVENHAGAGGTLADEYVAKSEPDGYTLLLSTSADAWNTTLYDNLKYNFIPDFTPVATMARSPGVLVVNPSVPAQSVAELIAAAKASPGKITVASAGIGSAPHMYWELFRSMTEVNMVHVPYRGGGPAIADLLGGQVMVYFGTSASTMPYVKAGRLRALGVTTARRLPAFPDIPAVAETVPGYEATIFVGLAAPHATPAAIVDKLNGAITASLSDATMQQRIADVGDTPLPLSSDAFAKLVAAETDKWGKVIREAHIRAE
jgi:tripartite-type tricarboxylate transporter receptor subunit TctC